MHAASSFPDEPLLMWHNAAPSTMYLLSRALFSANNTLSHAVVEEVAAEVGGLEAGSFLS